MPLLSVLRRRCSLSPALRYGSVQRTRPGPAVFMRSPTLWVRANSTAPEGIALEDTAREGTAPEGVAPIAPEDTAPEDAAPEDAAPEDAAPEEATPEEATPKDTTLEGAAPEDSARGLINIRRVNSQESINMVSVREKIHGMRASSTSHTLLFRIPRVLKDYKGNPEMRPGNPHSDIHFDTLTDTFENWNGILATNVRKIREVNFPDEMPENLAGVTYMPDSPINLLKCLTDQSSFATTHLEAACFRLSCRINKDATFARANERNIRWLVESKPPVDPTKPDKIVYMTPEEGPRIISRVEAVSRLLYKMLVVTATGKRTFNYPGTTPGVPFNTKPRSRYWRQVEIPRSRDFSTSTRASLEVASEPVTLRPEGAKDYVLRTGGFVLGKGKIRDQMEKHEKKLLSEIHNATDPQPSHSVPGGLRHSTVGGEIDFGAVPEIIEEPVDYETGGSNVLELGDLCELRSSSGGVDMGIHLRPTRGGEETADFLTSQGMIEQYFPSRILWFVRAFADRSDIEKLTKQYDQLHEFVKARSGVQTKDEEPVVVPPKALTHKILRPVREFQREASRCYSSGRAKLDTIYEQFAHETEPMRLPVKEAAEAAFGKDCDMAKLYATHLSLINDGLRFRVDKGFHRETQTYRVRSKRELRMVDSVTEWVRKTSLGVVEKFADFRPVLTPLEKFIDKAKYVIDASRAIRKQRPSEQAVYTEQVKLDVIWDVNDRFFIEYTRERLYSYGLQATPIEGLVPYILRATGRYGEADERFDANTTYTFLQELGVFSPWENFTLQNEALELPGVMTPRANGEQRKYDEIRGKLFEEIGLTDSLASVRKDWGDMPVYCIDDATAHEIDDGLSVERASDTEIWIHAHISNPSAFIPPDHWIAQIAARRAVTAYILPKAYPLLPASISNKLNVQSGSQVLTISVKINNEGDILEQNVQAGIVHNVQQVTYSQLGDLLGMHKPEPLIIEIGKPPPKKLVRPSTKISKKDLENLRLLETAYLTRKRRRARENMANMTLSKREIEVFDDSVHPLKSTTPILYRGHPAMRYEVNPPLPTPNPSELVAEMMVLANAATAQFCVDHAIPTVFRGCEYNEARPDVLEDFRKNVLPSRDEYGNITDPLRFINTFTRLGKTNVMVGPPAMPHVLLGLPGGYLRATSPLRRFSDMLVHWNLGAHLLGQPMIFSHAQLEEAIEKHDLRERITRFAQVETDRFWGAVAIKRLLETHGRRALPRKLTFIIKERQATQRSSIGVCVELQCAGRVHFPSSTIWTTISIGDTLAVDIRQVHLSERLVVFDYKHIIHGGQRQRRYVA